MKQSNTCPKCGSGDVVKARAIDRGEGDASWTMEVATYDNPDALIFKGKKSADLEAWVCRECGFTEFYAIKPDYLKGEDD
ncbi:MAG: hypothetical protein AAGI37_14020 [Planctomycetota bacterium]